MTYSQELADAYGGPVELNASVFAHVEEGLKKNPDGPAVIFMHQPASHLASLTGFHVTNGDNGTAQVSASHGMTEGGGIFKWPFFDVDVEKLPYFGEVCPPGSPQPGSRMRICDVENGQVARRDQIGESHVCSDALIKHYLGGTDEDSFYEDGIGRWFKTGDLAMMSKDDIVWILGRVKDRIKRAGVPTTPAALESCIENFTASQTSVVGIPHSSLGHEPFAVVKSLRSKTEDQVHQQVLDLFGRDYALGAVVSLHELGLDNFPLNATGKITKTTLQDRIVSR